MLALLYDIHGNLPALEAVLEDARERRATRYLLGGDMVPFGAWPAETLQRLRQLDDAVWIRGNTERWLADPPGPGHPMLGALDACREAVGDAVADELGALPERVRVDGDTIAWHGSPKSDVDSFMPDPADDEDELLAGVVDRRLVFGHTHLQFRRSARTAAGEVELLNPGSVGVPLDGDHRAAYALLAPDGSVELRRVAYDHATSANALRERFGRAGWVEIIAGRIERAGLEAS
jgi:predicted phosphodiesterase